MPTVVSVAVVQTIKSAGFSWSGQQGGPGEGGSNPFGFDFPFGDNPFGQFFGQIPHQFKERGTRAHCLQPTGNYRKSGSITPSRTSISIATGLKTMRIR
jgi:hypothetical protein